jgi:hypothetical protein
MRQQRALQSAMLVAGYLANELHCHEAAKSKAALAELDLAKEHICQLEEAAECAKYCDVE